MATDHQPTKAELNMTIESTSSINQRIKEYVEKNPKVLFDPSTCNQLLLLLKTHIFGDNPSEKVNAISLLSTLSERAPKSKQTEDIYDINLFTVLFSLLSLNIKPSTFSSILRISSVSLSGRLTSQRVPILRTVQKNSNIIPIICAKVTDDPSNVIEFFSKLLTCAVDTNYPELIAFMRSLRSCGFFISICELIEDRLTSSDVKSRISKLTEAIIKVKDYLKRIPINIESKVYKSMVHEVVDLYLHNLNETGQNSTTDDYVRAGLSENPADYIVNNYNSVNLLDILFFLKSSNMSFKKEYFEHCIFANEDSRFPLSTMAVEISNFLFGDVLNTNVYPNVRDNLYAVDSLYFSSMINVLRIWKASKATPSDIPVVIIHLRGLMRYADSLLTLKNNGEIIHPMREVLDSLTLLTFEEIKKLQTTEWKSTEEKLWTQNGLDTFNDYLRKEVLEFVREQRLLRLSKGSWVYSEDPVDLAVQGKKPQMYFMILSPNNSALIYKEFKTRSKIPPNIDKTGRYLNINTIASFETSKDEVDRGASIKSNEKWITLKSRSSFNKINLKNKHKKVMLSFYTDTNEASYIWSDGLKLMSNAKLTDLSDDTKTQMETLTNVRKSGQLANLDDEDLRYVANMDLRGQPDCYNPNILESLTRNFYYD